MALHPLAQSRADQLRFVDRKAETDAIIRAVGHSQNVLLLGQPGSGRTSLLNHVAWLLGRREDSPHTVLVSGEVAHDAAQLLGVLVARVQRLAEPGGTRGRWLEDLRAISMPDGPFGQAAQPAVLMELLDLLGEQLAALEHPVRLMVDGIAPSVAHAVFGSLRNELWALPGAGWIVAGDSAARPLYLEPPADAFFAQTIELGPLDDADAAELLRAHVPELTNAEVEQAVAAGGGNPRRLLRGAASLQQGIVPTATGELPHEAAVVAGPLAGALVEYLNNHGPTAASDPAMLRQIGASRQRASQLMHQLQSAGLLETIEHREPGRRGRPARRFAVRASA